MLDVIDIGASHPNCWNILNVKNINYRNCYNTTPIDSAMRSTVPPTVSPVKVPVQGQEQLRRIILSIAIRRRTLMVIVTIIITIIIVLVVLSTLDSRAWVLFITGSHNDKSWS